MRLIDITNYIAVNLVVHVNDVDSFHAVADALSDMSSFRSLSGVNSRLMEFLLHSIKNLAFSLRVTYQDFEALEDNTHKKAFPSTWSRLPPAM